LFPLSFSKSPPFHDSIPGPRLLRLRRPQEINSHLSITKMIGGSPTESFFYRTLSPPVAAFHLCMPKLGCNLLSRLFYVRSIVQDNFCLMDSDFLRLRESKEEVQPPILTPGLPLAIRNRNGFRSYHKIFSIMFAAGAGKKYTKHALCLLEVGCSKT